MDVQEVVERITREQMEDILRGVIDNFLIPKHRQLGMRTSGEWENSLRAVGDVIRGKKYTEQLEYGRRPGKFAPIEPLKQWVRLKFGLSDEAEVTRMAWAVNTKMKQAGTSWYRKGGSDLMEVLYSNEVIDYINRRLGDVIKEQIQLFVSQEIRASFKN